MSNWQQIIVNGQICTGQVSQGHQEVTVTLDLFNHEQGHFEQRIFTFPLDYWENCTVYGSQPDTLMAK